MTAASCRLAIYARPAVRDDRGRVLGRCLAVSLLACVALGLALWRVAPPAMLPPAQRVAHRITFQAPVVPPAIPAPEPEPTLSPEPEPTPEPEPAAPEITPETVLAQPVDQPAVAAAAERPAATRPVSETAPAAPARRVYGVRRVLARGLGGGDAAAGGLVSKRGNTLDGVADTLAATAADLQGELAALSTVEQAPEPIHQVKPRYSEALIAARAGGLVTARLLVDTDGTVAAVRIVEDIGHDSAALATGAFEQFRFRPARRHGEPVAVWIVFRMRFEFQE